MSSQYQIQKPPLVTVGIPVYNEARYLNRLLQSVISQTYQNIEIIITDNASTDGTWDIIEEFKRRDNRITAIRHSENIGALNNFLYSLKQSQRKYFIWAGGHDIWDVTMLEECVDLLEHNDNVALVAPVTTWIDGEGLEIRRDSKIIDTSSAKSPAERVLLMYQQMTRCSAFYGLHRSDVLKSTLPWPECIGGDFHVLMRIAAKGNILTAKECCWMRRITRAIDSIDNSRRQLAGLGIIGVKSFYPIFFSRVYAFYEFVKFPGSIASRFRLLKLALLRLFLDKQQRKILSKELFKNNFLSK